MKLLQLNMFLRPPIVLLKEYRDERAQRLIDEILLEYDILTLQECFGFWTGRRKKLIKQAKEQGYYAAYSKLSGRLKSLAKGKLKFVDAGLVTLSRYPIESKVFHAFKNGSNSDSLAMKGVLYTLLDLKREDGLKLHVFTTHTQASYSYKPSDSSVNIRIQQIKELEMFIKTTIETSFASDESPIIVTGDFNMDTLQPCKEYDEAIESLRRCSRKNVGFLDPISNKYGNHVPTATPYEFDNKSGSEIRSSFQRKDYNDLAKLCEKQDHALSKTEKNYLETDRDSFWADQRLDYVFVENAANLKVEDAAVESFDAKGTSPYSHLSDHFGISVSLSL